jgi:hypothetical protein
MASGGSMRTRRLLTFCVVLVLAAAAPVAQGAQGRSQGRGRGGEPETSVPVVFRDSDRAAFREYIVAHRIVMQALPPGIAKQVARGKSLPPGIAKRTLPEGLLRIAPKVPDGVSFAFVGEVVVALRGGVVIDVLAGLFAK